MGGGGEGMRRGCSALFPTDNGSQQGLGGTAPQLPQKLFFSLLFP